MLRLLRILPRVPALALVMGSLFETLKNLKHCAGILFAAFYLYASFGMILFQGESSTIKWGASFRCPSSLIEILYTAAVLLPHAKFGRKETPYFIFDFKYFEQGTRPLQFG